MGQRVVTEQTWKKQDVSGIPFCLEILHLHLSLKMTTFKAADSKREEFRKYLEKAGVLDTLTKVLVVLYEEPEKPNNALDFLKQHLNVSGPESADVEALKLEVTELRQKCEQLQEENNELKMKLQQLDPPQEPEAPEV